MSPLRRDATVSLADRKQIDQICLAFEDEWLAGRRPVIEPFLSQVDERARGVLLTELLLLELDYRRGLDPPVLIEDYVRRFPAFSAVVRSACDRAARSPGSPRFVPGSSIARYRVRRLIGTGAFACVYLAWDDQLQRDVAVKVPHQCRLGKPEDRRRWVEEARAIARVKHPRIVALHDAAVLDDGTVYLVMQYVPGSSLRQLLDQNKMSPREACRIVAEVADAVDTAHRAGVIHRDLKPSNILIDEQGLPHVCDFGLALRATHQSQRAREWAGTPAYMAPEQLRGRSRELDGRADVWALGVVLYEMLGGRHPFASRDADRLTQEILQHDPPPLRKLDPRISRGAERVCTRCLAKRPTDRYATAAELAQSLRSLERPRSRAVPALAVALLLTLLGGWFFGWQPPPPAPLPLLGSIELLLWDPATPRRQGVKLTEPETLPVRAGDRVRVNVQLNQPAFIYVVWLDTLGAPLPVYPWQNGSWHTLGAEQPEVSLTLPAEQHAGWEMRVPHDGMETLLLLARRRPLPADLSLPQLLSDSAGPPVAPRRHAVWFHEGRPLSPPPTDDLSSRPGLREPVFQHRVRIDDPLLYMQQHLASQLAPHFELVHAVSFPVEGK